jgi:phenylalanyl-tRNA synthetase alpha chain
MEELLEKLDTYRKEIIDTEISGADAAEAYRIRFLGTKGIVKNLFQEMKQVPPEKKKEFGQILNEFKQLAESKYESAKDTVIGQRSSVNEKKMEND